MPQDTEKQKMLGQLGKGAFSKRKSQKWGVKRFTQKTHSPVLLWGVVNVADDRKGDGTFGFISEAQVKVGEQGVDQFSGRAQSPGTLPCTAPSPPHKEEPSPIFILLMS